MTDLTKIATPFGLLDAETQKALQEHGGPYEIFNEDGWSKPRRISWFKSSVYRVKPKPPKPREWWINVYFDKAGYLNAGQLHFTRSKADEFGDGRIECIHVREVLE